MRYSDTGIIIMMVIKKMREMKGQTISESLNKNDVELQHQEHKEEDKNNPRS